MIYRVMRPLLFRLDPEGAHNLIFGGLAAAERVLAALGTAAPELRHSALEQQLWGLTFPNPVGLAAGLDKDARAPHVWPLLGFGFAELGTITAEAQAGNARPRLFRLAADRALINRMGFNNCGAVAVRQRLERLWRRSPPAVPIGINLGKSRVTPIEAAAEDYVRSLRHLFPFAAYVVINVSSPNTPGLRDLQEERHLEALLAALRVENGALAVAHRQTPRPLLVKVAPDLSDEALATIVHVAREGGAAGLIATNTTIGRQGLATATSEAGGLSGAPLRERATTVVRTLHRIGGPTLPIIGVGGIFTAAEAYAKIRAGASLVQIYTGMIYEGPWLARRIAAGLVELLQRDGLASVRDAVGRDA